jgi:hypothetical protein
MSDMRAQVGELLDAIRPVITAISVYKWEGDDKSQFWEFLRRAALQRQFEAMDAICAMSDAGHGHFGVTLLRPAFEELVWIEFLSKNVDIARILILPLSIREVATSIRAQMSYGGIQSLEVLGFENATSIRAQMSYGGIQSLEVLGFEKKQLIGWLSSRPKTEALIKEALIKLGWNNKKQLLPTMKFLAKSVGRDKEYDYVYHGTSRFVHFSTHELLRRVWGKHGEVYVSTKNFSRFWSYFALYWGFWILLHLVIACGDLVPDHDTDTGKDLDLYKERFTTLLGNLTRVPIITAEELEAWAVPTVADAPSDPQPSPSPPSGVSRVNCRQSG